MNNSLKLGQIGLCNLVLKTKPVQNKKQKTIKLNKIVFSQPYSHLRKELKVDDFNDIRTIHKAKVDENLIIESIEVLVELGYKHKGNGFTEVKANILGERSISGNYN